MRGRVPSGADLSVRVAARFARVEQKRESEIGDAGSHVAFEEDVFAFEVAMGYGRF